MPKVYTIKETAIYNCSLERAFKTAMLSDLSKVHTGKGIMPKVTHTSEDENWGQVGSTKKVHIAKSITQKGGFGSMDRVIERRENEYWKIEVYEFQSWILGFYKFVGEWETIELEPHKIQINYSYHLHAKQPLFYPLCWLFSKLFWPKYMRQVLNNIHEMCLNKEPYQYE